MPDGRECYLKAKANFDAIITQDEDQIIEQTRNFLFDCAKEKNWLTAEYFLDEFLAVKFPLEKLNLYGENDETVHWIIATIQDPHFDDCSDFVARISGYCRSLPDLPNKTDEYYYNKIHLDTYANVLAGQIATELVLE